MRFSTLNRRLPKPSCWLGLALLVPLALGIVLTKQASWRPVTMVCDSSHTPNHLLVAYAPDGSHIAIAGKHSLRLWDGRHPGFEQELVLEAADQISVAFAADSKSVFAIYGDEHTGALIVWDIAANQDRQIPLRHWTTAHQSLWPILDSTQHKRLIRIAFEVRGDAEHQQWQALLCDAQTGRMLTILPVATKGADAPKSYALSADGQSLAFGGYFPDPDHPGLSVIHTHTGQQESTFPFKPAPQFEVDETPPVAFTPDGKLLADGRHSGAIEVWSLQQRKLLYTLNAHTAPVTALAFAPDGKLLASGSEDKTVKLWNLPDGKLSRNLKSHTAGIYSLAFSPDGSSLASGSADGTIKLWRIR